VRLSKKNYYPFKHIPISLALGCTWLWRQCENVGVLERKGYEACLTELITLFPRTLQEEKYRRFILFYRHI